MKRGIRKIQIARRAVQIGVVLVLLAIPAVSRYGNYLSARELDRHMAKWSGTLQGQVLNGMDAAFRALPRGETVRAGEVTRNRPEVLAYAQSIRGGVWSMQAGSVSLTDPLAVAESVAARKRVVPILIFGALIPIVLTVLFGRVFCSWICPMNLLLEFTDKLRPLLKFLELPPRNVLFPRKTKYFLLLGGLLLAAVSSVPVLGYIYPPAIIGREAHELVYGIFDRAESGSFGFSVSGLTWLSLIIVGIAVVEVAYSRRWWCRYLCPGGALYGLLGAARPLRVKLEARKCTRCTDCITVCPVGLNPMMNRMGIDCDNCGLCISHCDDNALSYAVSLPHVTTTKNVLVPEGLATE